MINVIDDILKKYWGYDHFRPLQREIIESCMQGKDTLGLMPTGGGKSITFQVPTMACEGTCIVITPLVALMKDQVNNLRSRGIKATCIYSGMRVSEINNAFDNCINGDYKFLYISPERLSTEMFESKLRYLNISLLVVDEAHCISQWGYDFRPQYLQIAEFRKLIPQVNVLALTATATPNVVKEIQEKLLFKNANVFIKSFDRPNLSYIVRKGENKIQMLLHILQRVEGSAIVYVRSRARTKEIAEQLEMNGISAYYYHAGLPLQEKEQKQRSWMNDQCRVMVSTNAFGMGIDKPEVRIVIHYDLPNSLEEYYQEAGRAGRDEKRAYAVALYAPSDTTKLKKRLNDMFPEKPFIRRVYEALGNFYEIGEGYGKNSIHEFNLGKFCQVFKFPLLQAHYALQIIAQAGYIEYTEEIDSQARLQITVLRDKLYTIRELDREEDQLIQSILRLYTGIFADHVFINEELIAQRSNLRTEQVQEILIYLSKQKIVNYIPRRRTPYIVYLTNRLDPDILRISQAVWEDRRNRMEQRINGMLHYISSDTHCRVSMLLAYFGEETKQDCGHCDYCIEHKKKRTTHYDRETVEEMILAQLTIMPLSLEALIGKTALSPEVLIDTIRTLCDNQIIVSDAGKLTLKRPN